jgi:Fe-S cluster biogenesis protein NfuA
LNSANDQIKIKIEAALDTIRPYLMTDNGNVSVLEITHENVVKLKFEGACGSCSMNAMTFKTGIEETILRLVPEVKKVEAINLEGGM